MTTAVVLLSGGLDSATVLAMAKAEDRRCHTLSLDYGQRHRAELDAGRRMAEAAGVESHREVRVDLAAIGGSALTDSSLKVPEPREEEEIGQRGVPITYVPARNTVLLSIALALAETVGAEEIWCGVNAVDFSGYPDCRPVFIEAFERLARVATRTGTEGGSISIRAPLLRMSKAEIVTAGTRLGVDYAATVSCYQADEQGRACGRCDACILRRRGFEQAGLRDPTRYR
ncbi:MAG: 7-cyano-7-deazaguanine synthase QueC [Myxococcota bacterium]